MREINWKKEYADEKAGIYLRPMTIEDTDIIVDWRNRESVRKNFIYRGEFTREGHLNWIRTKVETGEVVQLIICELENDRAVGSTYVRDIDRIHNHGEFGIFIGEDDARGRGIGGATAALMIAFSFRELDLHRVSLRLLASNVAALHAYEKGGFVQEGVFRDEVFLDGAYRDVIRMAAIRKEG